MSTAEFAISRELGREELSSHRQHFVGITASIPRYAQFREDGTEVGEGGYMEWVADVRIGERENQAILRNVLISDWVIGVVTDLNIPVVCERGESGRVSIIARSEMRMPDVTLDLWSYSELGFLFMTHTTEQTDGTYIDGFGYNCGDLSAEVGTKGTWHWNNEILEFGGTDFDIDNTKLLETAQSWEFTEDTGP